MSHTAYKVTVCCRNTFFSCCHNTHMTAHARTTAWCIDCTACIYKDIKKSFFDTLFIDLLRCRNNHNTYIRVNGMIFQNCSCLSQVFHSSVRTGSDHNLIDLNWLHRLNFIDRLRITREMWECNCRTYFRKIDLDHIIIYCVLISLINCIFFLAMFCKISLCLFINREDPVLCTSLDRHICHRKTVIHRKTGNSVSGKFH